MLFRYLISWLSGTGSWAECGEALLYLLVLLLAVYIGGKL